MREAGESNPRRDLVESPDRERKIQVQPCAVAADSFCREASGCAAGETMSRRPLVFLA